MDALPLWVCRNLHESDEIGDTVEWKYDSGLKSSPEDCEVTGEKAKSIINQRCRLHECKELVCKEIVSTTACKTVPRCCKDVRCPARVWDCRTANELSSIKCICGTHQLRYCIGTWPAKYIRYEKRTSFYTFSRARHKCLAVSRNSRLLLSNYCLLMTQWFCTHTPHSFFLFLMLSSMLHPVHSCQPISADCSQASYKDLFMQTPKRACQQSYLHRYTTAYYDHLKSCAQLETSDNVSKDSFSDNALESSGHDLDRTTCVSPFKDNFWWKSSLFCNHFPWENLLTCNYTYRSDNKACNNIFPQNVYCDVMRIVNNDQAAYSAYIGFIDTLQKYATLDDYSIKWNESQCYNSYRSWVCLQYHQLYETTGIGVRLKVPPCDTYCLQTEASCPFFRIFNRTKLRGGQPTFICQGFDMENPTPVRRTNCSDFQLVDLDVVYPQIDATPPTIANLSGTTVHKIRHTNTILPYCAGCSPPAAQDRNFGVSCCLSVPLAAFCNLILVFKLVVWV